MLSAGLPAEDEEAGWSPEHVPPDAPWREQTSELPDYPARDQIGRGADWVKIYADYRWGPGGDARPTFTQEELETVVEVAESSGRWVVAHATTPESMRRSVEAAQASLEATQEDLHNVMVSLLAEVVLNYVEVRTFQSRLAVTEANIKTQQETYDLNQSR